MGWSRERKERTFLVVERDAELDHLNVAELVREREDRRRWGALHGELADLVAEFRHGEEVRHQG